MILRALGFSCVEPCFGFFTVLGLILPLANYVAYFMLNPFEFPRAFPAIILSAGTVSIAAYSYFMNLPITRAFEEQRFPKGRLYTNYAIIADIVAIVLAAIGLTVVLTHPRGFSPVGVTLCVLANTMFYVSYVPLIAGRIAVFRLDDEDHSKEGSSEVAHPNQSSPASETTTLVV